MQLLSLVSEPITCLTDRDMLLFERCEFVRIYRICVFGIFWWVDGPAMSIVYYVVIDTDELLVSTMRDRGKARTVVWNPNVSVCVLDERWLFSYLQVYCDAIVEDDHELVVDVMMVVGGRMFGESLGADTCLFVVAMAEEEGRVVLRCRFYSMFVQLFWYLYRNDQPEVVIYWVSVVLPWDTIDHFEGV